MKPAFNTIQGELEHKMVKLYYAHTNKRDFEIQIAKQDSRHSRLILISHREPAKQKHRMKNTDPDPLPPSDPCKPYQISKTERYHVDISQFMTDYRHDPAVNVCLFLDVWP